MIVKHIMADGAIKKTMDGYTVKKNVNPDIYEAVVEIRRRVYNEKTSISRSDFIAKS